MINKKENKRWKSSPQLIFVSELESLFSCKNTHINLVEYPDSAIPPWSWKNGNGTKQIFLGMNFGFWTQLTIIYKELEEN